MSDAARAFLEAVFEFSTHYAHYVKEMDENLHKRAVDYAKTFTESVGIEYAGCLIYWYDVHGTFLRP